MTKIQHTRYSNSKDEAKQQQRKELIKELCKSFVESAGKLIQKMETTIPVLEATNLTAALSTAKIKHNITYAKTHIELVVRRVLNEEKIPHDDKLFSIFKPYTEWICKGKAGVPQQLGLRVCIMEDQNGFILGHKIMPKTTDNQIGIPFLKEMKKTYPQISSCSFDKGFWSPENYDESNNLELNAIIPKKGRRSHADREREEADEFRENRKKHAAVESGINALMNHGLDKCPDLSFKAFERYTALGILARNLQKIGAELIRKKNEFNKRSEAIRKGLAEKKEKEAQAEAST